MPGALSRREAEVVALLGEHLTHAEIAERLVVSVRTVESHVASARRKLGIDGHTALVRYAAARRPRTPGLPVSLSPFVGRVGERAELQDTLRHQRLVSLVGAGGVGKTRLAVEVASALAEEHDGRVWFAELAPVSDPRGVPGTVVTSCALEDLPGRFPEDVLVRGLGGPPGLLLLDNGEHVLDAVALLVERLLQGCPDLRVLLTSRARLSVPFEYVHAVAGLDAAGDAVDLFEQRARAAGAAGLDAEQRHRAASVCEALGGLPLAVELAAARLPTLGFDGLEKSLAGQVDLLVGGARLSARQRSLADTLDWSLRLVEDAAAQMLARVSCFAGVFDVAAATAVACFGDLPPERVRGLLAALAEQSLVVAESGRWRLLEPVRQYASRRLGADEDEARRRHLHWAAGRCRALRAAPENDAVPALAAEVRAAVAWAADRPGDRDGAAALASVLASLLFARGAVRDAQGVFELAARLTDDPSGRSRLLADAASTARCRTLGEEALRLDVATLEAARAGADPGMVTAALAAVAETVVRFEGMFAAPPASDLTSDVLNELAARSADEAAALAVVQLARVQELDPDDPTALSAAEAAVASAEELTDPIRLSAALDALTGTQVTIGRLADATAIARRRTAVLAPLERTPSVALEVKDALHMTILLGCGSGDLQLAMSAARQHRRLPFLREQRDLGLEDLLLPAALAGHWDELLEAAEPYAEDWEASGRPAGAGRAVAPYAAATAYALLGDDVSARRWYDMAAVMRDRPSVEVARDSGFGPVLDGLVLLHRDEPDRAGRGLRAESPQMSGWYGSLFAWWRGALRAEAAVLADSPDAEQLLEEARQLCASSETLSLVVRRARALAEGDATVLPILAERFDALGVPYQAQRTRRLADP